MAVVMVGEREYQGEAVSQFSHSVVSDSATP